MRGRGLNQPHDNRDGSGEGREDTQGEEGIGPGRGQRAQDTLLEGDHRGREGEGARHGEALAALWAAINRAHDEGATAP